MDFKGKKWSVKYSSEYELKICIFECSGHIYIWHHCDEIDPIWEIPDIPEISSGNWTYRGRTEHYVNSHIEVHVARNSRQNTTV